MFDTSVFFLLQVTPPTKKPMVSENNPEPKLQPKLKNYVSIAEVQTQAKAGRFKSS